MKTIWLCRFWIPHRATRESRSGNMATAFAYKHRTYDTKHGTGVLGACTRCHRKCKGPLKYVLAERGGLT